MAGSTKRRIVTVKGDPSIKSNPIATTTNTHTKDTSRVAHVGGSEFN